MSAPQQAAGLTARLGLAGTLVYRDAAGAVLKAVPFWGSVPLAGAGLTVEQAQQLIEQQAPAGQEPNP